jgi:small subunit ribosomal protein S18
MADEKKRTGAPARGGAGGDKAGAGGLAGGKKQYFRRKKVCRFCVEKIDNINYKEVKLIGSFVAERGRIIPRRISGVCTPHQRQLSEAIKKARNIALLPFAAEL